MTIVGGNVKLTNPDTEAVSLYLFLLPIHLDVGEFKTNNQLCEVVSLLFSKSSEIQLSEKFERSSEQRLDQDSLVKISRPPVIAGHNSKVINVDRPVMLQSGNKFHKRPATLQRHPQVG